MSFKIGFFYTCNEPSEFHFYTFKFIFLHFILALNLNFIPYLFEISHNSKLASFVVLILEKEEKEVLNKDRLSM
jgi:hypothetical protein